MNSLQIMRAAAVAAFAWQLTLLASAEDVSPPLLPDSSVQPTLSRPPAIGFRIGATRILFETVPLEKIRRTVGGGAVGHRGDAGDSAYWLCYTVLNGRAHRLWLVAGELDGPSHLVSRVVALRLPIGADAAAGCPALPRKLSISLAPTVRLGMTEVQVESVLGPPSLVSGDVRQWAYLRAVPVGRASFERSSYVRVVLKEGSVAQVSSGQTTTN